MIARYTLPEMGAMWSEETKLNNWLKIEIAACEGWAKLGKIPKESVENIKQKANFEVKRVKEIEAEVHHDVIAFLTNVAEYVGEDSKYIHLGMTSSDILDTGIAMQMRDSADLILDKLEKLKSKLEQQAIKHKYTMIIGRTHGVHGEPTTFGLKMALWYTEIERSIERLNNAKQVISYGAISGAVGNFAHLDPRVEEYVCENLGLTPCKVSTQIIQRDRHAEYVSTLAIVASTLEKMATEIRNLQRTDILEVEEPFAKKQKGSSAMPHKRNPMISERVAGLARVIRGNAIAAMENVALWHERDLTHSSVERIIIPDSCILLDYMLDKFINVVAGLVVYEDNMLDNINNTRGLVFSQQLMLALVDKGLLREEAYELVQRNAMKSWTGKLDFKALVQNDEDIAKLISKDELEKVFDFNIYTEKVDFILDRCDLKTDN
ncbi:Adenylosuccinate lyase [Candidatus Syntrophocurvum alkaliphilum]|uniref:Adenylosuccinate lyase n=1 Tax=Candidatus Syntrophocurvum alkaliphilum TaxID=2293317 RepID=A0A6I6D8A0_9FIRM|nr:adenylosuccinate lyase [Candidatus Syntrophocurvum alkaliphilum]QGT98807.1 Adenylosuccinate lyase [Candidatus Syntrophocurvum alkaliphilum]